MPQQLHDSVVQRWGWDIVSGSLPPGSRIVADDAAEQLGVSRTVVREAVRVLESMGLITVRRRVGITVLPPEAWNPFDPQHHSLATGRTGPAAPSAIAQ